MSVRRQNGLDFEVWYDYGELSRRMVAAFWLHHDARAYIERRSNKEKFTLVNREGDCIETVKDWGRGN